MRKAKKPTTWHSDKAYMRFYRVLAPIVERWQWTPEPTAEELTRARRDLREFLFLARELLPKAKVYPAFEPLAVENLGTYYTRRMMVFGGELNKGQYVNACHELYDVLSCSCIQDRRVLCTIIQLLEAYI